MNKICWSENFKIRLASCDDSMMLHDVIKLMVVKKLLKKYERDRNFLRIYTEHPLENGLICDVYMENARTKEAFAYEIQKNVSKAWLESRKNVYKNWEVPFFTSDWIMIPIKEAPNDLDELNKWLDKFIF